MRGDVTFAERCRAEAAQLRLNIEQNGWDGEWYRRAYFDDGSPLGSASNAECRIDSIAQSWSVLSGAGDAGRSRMAMDAVDRRLVRRDHALIQLLDPPFDKSALNPGYIKGYVPGVRENGGQYTHAAIWAAMAFAALGDSRRAWELLAMINPVNHCEVSGGDRDLQGGTVRGRGRRLCAPAAHRPRRMDLVHGLGRLDVPADRGIAPGAEAGSGQAAFRSVPPRGLEGVQGALPVSRDGL